MTDKKQDERQSESLMMKNAIEEFKRGLAIHDVRQEAEANFLIRICDLALRAESAELRLKELERDAGRYRWLRERVTFEDLNVSVGEVGYAVRRWFHDSWNRQENTLDAAIDAALAEHKGAEG